MDTQTLKQFGLSDKEAAVYAVLLTMGPSVVSEIASRSKINRTTAYDILESLVGYGLVSYVSEKKKKHYVAENPDLLVSYLEKKSKEFSQKAEEAKNILPELKSAYNLIPQKPKVKYYEGEEGIIAMYEDSLTSRTEILSWLDTNQTAEFDEEYFRQYYKRRAAKDIHIKGIVNEGPYSRVTEERNKEEKRELRIIPQELMNVVPESYIYDNKVSFMSLKEKFGVMIESKDIAEAQRAIYKLAWRAATEIAKKNKSKDLYSQAEIDDFLADDQISPKDTDFY